MHAFEERVKHLEEALKHLYKATESMTLRESNYLIMMQILNSVRGQLYYWKHGE